MLNLIQRAFERYLACCWTWFSMRLNVKYRVVKHHPVCVWTSSTSMLLNAIQRAFERQLGWCLNALHRVAKRHLAYCWASPRVQMNVTQCAIEHHPTWLWTSTSVLLNAIQRVTRFHLAYCWSSPRVQMNVTQCAIEHHPCDFVRRLVCCWTPSNVTLNVN